MNSYEVWQDDEYIGSFSGLFLMEEGIKTEMTAALDSRSYLAVAVAEEK